MRAWSQGSLPLLSPYSWVGGALGAEYQFGVFSVARFVLEAIAWLLPLPLLGRAAFLFIAYAAICAAGAYLLARSHDIRPPLAFMVAVIAALNGWMLWWGTTWFAASAGFAWIPWYWLALRGRGKWSWLAVTVTAYLIVAAGSPYVTVMVPLLLLFHLQRRNVLASLLGLLLAAPAILMFAELFRAGARVAGQRSFGSMWTVPLSALPGLIIPAYKTTWRVFTESQPHRSVELLGALVPLAGLLVSRGRNLLRRELVLAILALALAMLPSPPPLRWSFHWLPLFHLALAIAGAHALQHVRWSALAAPLTILLIAVPFVLFSHESTVPLYERHDAALQRAPFDPSRRYLAMYGLEGIREIDLRPGNTPMLAGLHFINGYSPLGLEGLATIFRFEVHGTMPPDRAEEILRYESGRNQLLHHLGVDGLVVPTELAARNAPLLAQNGWRPVARAGTCIVLHRTEHFAMPLFQSAFAVKVANDADGYRAIGERKTPQLPVVLLTAGGPTRYWQRELANVRETRLQTSFEVRGKGPRALVVFRRPWLPGLRATLHGEALPVLRADMAMPAIELPPDAYGEVRLFYRPASLIAGLVIAALALLIMSIRIRATWSRN